MKKLALRTWLLVGCVTITSTQSSAFVLCAKVKQSTSQISEGASLKLRTICKNSEQTVDASDLGLQVSAGPVVRDSEGVLVGQLQLEEPGLPSVVLHRDGRYFVARAVHTIALTGTTGDQEFLYFTDASCSTTPYIPVINPTPELVLRTVAATIEATGNVEVYYPDVSRTMMSLSHRKHLSNGACVASSINTYVAEALGPLTFQPPFRVE